LLGDLLKHLTMALKVGILCPEFPLQFALPCELVECGIIHLLDIHGPINLIYLTTFILMANHFKKRAGPVPEAPTRVGSGEGNNRSKVLPPQKFCRETASNPGPGDSAS
jgi:hypothetical protein